MDTTFEPAVMRRLRRDIRARNRAFSAMSAREKRVHIAKDVLRQLAKGKIKAVNGEYFVPGRRVSNRLSDVENEGKDLSKLLGGESCRVCAIGAAFVCSVKKLDVVKAGQMEPGCWGVFDDNSMRDYLVATGAFSYKQVQALEDAFEGYDEEVGMDGFNTGVRSSKERLRRIMQRLVDTGGRVSFPTRELPASEPEPAPAESCPVL